MRNQSQPCTMYVLIFLWQKLSNFKKGLEIYHKINLYFKSSDILNILLFYCSVKLNTPLDCTSLQSVFERIWVRCVGHWSSCCVIGPDRPHADGSVRVGCCPIRKLTGAVCVWYRSKLDPLCTASLLSSIKTPGHTSALCRSLYKHSALHTHYDCVWHSQSVNSFT